MAERTLRIIAGTFKGRKICCPASVTVRPTKDRIRESVFNMIAPELEGAHVLDMFAGSGAYGLESLSRGASRAVFVDNDPVCAGMIGENARALGIEDVCSVLNTDAFGAMDVLGRAGNGFDVIFCDPPYNKNIIKNILNSINQYDILNPSGILIAEHYTGESVPGVLGNLSTYKQKTYRDISVSIFRKSP